MSNKHQTTLWDLVWILLYGIFYVVFLFQGVLAAGDNHYDLAAYKIGLAVIAMFMFNREIDRQS